MVLFLVVVVVVFTTTFFGLGLRDFVGDALGLRTVS